MDKHLKEWLDVLQNMSNDNTYKLAWTRAIVEIIYHDEYLEAEGFYHEISFDLISKKILKYYWNQIFFFSLKQSANQAKKPVIYQITNDLIEHFIQYQESNVPVWFDKASKYFEKNYKMFNQTIAKISSALKVDVCWRFLYANQKNYDLYKLNEKKDKVSIRKDDAKVIKDYAVVLTQIINYKWAQLLEKYNRSPRIVSKIRNSQELRVKRSNLNKFKEILLKQYEMGIIHDFYTNEVLEVDQITLDHVIPWSFMYSDDIWNLVITSKSNNSKKSNNIPDIQYIEKLKARNHELLEFVDEPMKSDLLLAIENDYVTKYYFDLII